MKEVVLITGTGRSGTSLCSDILNSLGYLIPSESISSLYEITKVQHFNEKINKDEIKRFIKEGFKKFGNKLSIKDPRFARNETMPIWTDILIELGAEVKWIFCFRHPSPTLKSLNKFGIKEGTDLIWWKLAVDFALSRKDKFLFLDYDLSNGSVNVLCLKNFLNLTIIPENKYNKNRHHFKTDDDLKKFEHIHLVNLYLEMVAEQKKYIGNFGE